MARVLVTGASGFIGSHLVEELCRRGDEITCLVRPTSRRDRLTMLGVRLADGDVTDGPGVAAVLAAHQPQIVCHLAGLTRALSDERFRQVNAGGVANVAEACAALAEPPTLLLVSSLAAAGPAPADRPRTETDAPAPVSAYGRSKLAGEYAARRFADRLPITIVRPPIVFGPYDTDVLHLFRMVRRLGFLAVPGPPGCHLSLIHVADLVQALLSAAARGERLPASASGAAHGVDPGHGCYFVASAESPTIAEFAHLLAHAVGRRRVRVVHLPPVVARVAGVIGDALGHLRGRFRGHLRGHLRGRFRGRGRPLPINSDKIAEALAGAWVCATAKAHNDLALAIPAPLDQCLADTADWYRQHGQL